MTIDSPSTVGSVATRMSRVRPAAAALSEMRPSCGLRRSAMSSFASTFRRVVTPGHHPLRDPLDLVEHAVDAEADEQRILLRLEVDVGGPVLGGLEDHGVDEPDERRIGDAVVDLEVVDLLLLHLQLQLLLDGGAGAERLRGTRQSAELDEDVVAGRHAELERVARREPELVDSLNVAGVGNGDPERPVLDRVRNGRQAFEDMERRSRRLLRRRRL